MATKLVKKGARNGKQRTKKPNTKLSPLKRPEGMSLEAWQIELRKQFGSEQKYHLRNLGGHPVFTDFEVANPTSHNSYRVIIRGTGLGDNHCSCPDFATNTLGTCKHIEFTLTTLQRKPTNRRLLWAGFQPEDSEVFLHYGPCREVRFRPGSDCPRRPGPARGQVLRRRWHAAAGSVRPVRGVSRPRPATSSTNCCAVRMPCNSWPRSATPSGGRQQIQEAFPRGSRSAGFKKLLKVPLYDYQARGSPVRGPGRAAA